MPAEPKDLFLESLSRCRAAADFLPRFYDRFLACSEDIRSKFRATDFKQQIRRLDRSLELIALATAGDPEGLREIKERAETHDRHHLDIAPRLYADWLESIVATAADYDEMWDADLEDAWREVLGFVIDHMTRRY